MGEILIGIGSGGKTCMWIFQESVPQRGAEKPFRSWWRTLEFKDFFSKLVTGRGRAGVFTHGNGPVVREKVNDGDDPLL